MAPLTALTAVQRRSSHAGLTSCTPAPAMCMLFCCVLLSMPTFARFHSNLCCTHAHCVAGWWGKWRASGCSIKVTVGERWGIVMMRVRKQQNTQRQEQREEINRQRATQRRAEGVFVGRDWLVRYDRSTVSMGHKQLCRPSSPASVAIAPAALRRAPLPGDPTRPRRSPWACR